MRGMNRGKERERGERGGGCRGRQREGKRGTYM